MSIILGLNTNHSDSSACLVVNGKLIGAISEERLGKRLKSTSDFPHNAIYKLMDNFGFNLNDLTHIAISRNSKANLFARFKYSITNPSVLNSSVKEYFRRQRSINQDSLVKLVSISLNTDPSTFSGKVIYVEHHLAHIASSYYLSNFDKCSFQ